MNVKSSMWSELISTSHRLETLRNPIDNNIPRNIYQFKALSFGTSASTSIWTLSIKIKSVNCPLNTRWSNHSKTFPGVRRGELRVLFVHIFDIIRNHKLVITLSNTSSPNHFESIVPHPIKIKLNSNMASQIQEYNVIASKTSLPSFLSSLFITLPMNTNRTICVLMMNFQWWLATDN